MIKRFLLILVLLNAMLVMLTAEVIQKGFVFAKPTIEKIQGYDKVTINNLPFSSQPGYPELPILPVQMAIPAGEEVTKIRIDYSRTESIDGSYNVYPRQKPYPISYQAAIEFEEQAAEIYSKNELFPEKLSSKVYTQFLRGHSIALFNLNPVQYNPVTKELIFHSSITITLETAPTPQAADAFQNFYRSDVSTQNRVKNLVSNPELISRYPNSNRNREIIYDYVIITSSTYQYDFADFIEFKINQGYNVFLKTTDEIFVEYSGIDNGNKIRNFITDAYQTLGADYILLGGDTAIIPHRGFWVNSYGTEDYNIPSDLYYSGLDRVGTGSGPDWNVNQDTKWGEHYEADYFSEVYIGRISAENSTEFAAALNKQIMYQNSPVTADLENALMVGEELNDNPQTNGGDYKDEIVTGGYFNGYSTAGFTDNFSMDTLYDRDGYWNANQLFTKFNNGLNILNHLGHSNVDYNMKLYNSSVSNTNITVNGIDHNYFIIYSQGCLPAAFEQNCIAEKFTTIENGCAVFVGNTRYGWYQPGGTNSSSQLMDREFFDALFDEDITQVGPMNADSKEDNAAQCSDDNIRWVYYELTLFGDPSLDVWTAIPEEITATFNPSIPLGTTEIDFQTDAPYARIGLIQSGEIIGNGQADESGNATIELFESIIVPENISVSIIAHNKIPYSSQIVVISNEPYVIFESYDVNDTAGNGNSLPDYDESITLNVSLQNVGTQPASNVNAVLTTDDDYISITADANNYGDMNANEIVTISDAFAFDIADDVPDQHNVMFTIVASGDGQNDWTSYFNMTVNAPEIFSEVFTVNDITGNNNGIIDPEENVDLIAAVENIGHADSPTTFAYLTCDNEDIIIETGLLELGQIAAQGNANAIFNLTVGADIPLGSTVTFDLTIIAGFYEYFTFFTKSIGIILEDFETGDFTSFPWEFIGAEDWFISDGAYEGAYCAKSGTIGNSASTNLVIEIDVLIDGEISFYRTVSSEANYDYLRFYVDNNQLDQWSGDVGWEEVTYPITQGNHQLEWRYEKDTYVSGGTDCARIDFITFPALGIATPPIINVDPSIVNIELGIDQTAEEIINLSNIGGEVLDYTISLTNTPEWLEVTPTSGSLNPTEMEEITLSFDTYTMTAGQYPSSLLIEDGLGEETIVPVALTVTATGIGNNLPMVTEMIGNYPNPFNPVTNIRFSLSSDAQVSLSIYNIKGQKVKTLIDKELPVGYHTVIWDGRDDDDKKVSSGVYFHKFDANDNDSRYTSLKKIILLK